MMTNNNDYYATDDSPIEDDNEISQAIDNGVVDDKSKTLANWLMTKMFGKSVRKSLSLFVEWISVSFNSIKNDFSSLLNRVDKVEERQTDVEDKFKDVIANATKDSEVINARDSTSFGTKYKVIDDRFEYIEKLIAKFVPNGFSITINHNMDISPSKIIVERYQNAIDTEKDGFETSDKVFGSEIENVPFTQIFKDNNSLTIQMPLDYRVATKVVTQAEINNDQFTFKNVEKYVTGFNRAVEVVAVDSSYKELGRSLISKNSLNGVQGYLSIDSFDVENNTISGTILDNKVSKVRLFISDSITKSTNNDGLWYLFDGINTLRFELIK